ncbi:ABC transporter permease [Cuneatibacter sp. NSJ-177]|uniref:ABC transporter permease n=1 Tax=Cuneatibacter sp. NSJ-177 TaxID=2931401 RepID=UPI001FD5863D|nr:ABC transporter permease [Cuneatibacter sp. NSJ-177]MCJ7835089.1 ABC transporter permease [Cuneatibacter sp. NSJ-177]
MGKYLLKRLGQTILVMFLVSILVFLLMSFIPGDPVYAMLGEDITPEEYQVAYEQLGLDKPLITRYAGWLGGVFQGDFGVSYQYHVEVEELIASRVTVTLYLAVLSTVIGYPIGILFGMLTAVYRGKKADSILTFIANLCNCLPQFWIGICLMYFLALKSGLLPSYGFTWPWEDFGMHMKQLIMPLICLSIGSIAGVTRQTRSSMLEVIRQDYVRTARSKGLREKKVILIHVMKNGLIPIITMLGNRLAFMVGGSMFVESVFQIPGMGSLFVKAIGGKDIPVVQACVLLTALVSCLAYIVTDLLYMLVDPRISLVESE